VGQDFLSAYLSQQGLECFNVASVTADTDGHDVLQETGLDVQPWVVATEQPAPGTLVTQNEPIYLTVRSLRPTASLSGWRCTWPG
jgi:hypothetical protein